MKTYPMNGPSRPLQSAVIAGKPFAIKALNAMMAKIRSDFQPIPEKKKAR